MAAKGFGTGLPVNDSDGYNRGMKPIKVIVEKHPDGYVAYPLGLRGVIVGQGDSFDEALADVTSAIKFHVETFGLEELDGDPPVLEAFLTEAQVAVA